MVAVILRDFSILSLMHMCVYTYIFYIYINDLSFLIKKNILPDKREFQNEMHKYGNMVTNTLYIILDGFESKPGGNKLADHKLIHSSHGCLEDLGGLQDCEI